MLARKIQRLAFIFLKQTKQLCRLIFKPSTNQINNMALPISQKNLLVINKKNTFIALLGIFLVMGFVFAVTTTNEALADPVCTEDAFICPDGTTLTRGGLSCDFGECPPIVCISNDEISCSSCNECGCNYGTQTTTETCYGGTSSCGTACTVSTSACSADPQPGSGGTCTSDPNDCGERTSY